MRNSLTTGAAGACADGRANKTAASLHRNVPGINDGIVVATEPRSPTNTTPTSIETFVKEVFVPAYQGNAVSA